MFSRFLATFRVWIAFVKLYQIVMQKAILPSICPRSNAIYRDLMQPDKTGQESNFGSEGWGFESLQARVV